MRTSCAMPLLPVKQSRTLAARTFRWRLRSVVSPYESLSRAYSGLPIRTSVVSSRRTTVAATLSRDMPGFARSRVTRARIFDSAWPNAAIRAYLLASRISRHNG